MSMTMSSNLINLCSTVMATVWPAKRSAKAQSNCNPDFIIIPNNDTGRALSHAPDTLD